MRKSTAAERSAIVTEIEDALLDAAREWLKYSRTDALGDLTPIRFAWMDDGTVVIEADGVPVVRVRCTVACEVVECDDAANEPHGPVLDRTWATVPAGWFVRTPKGAWIEVTDTSVQNGQQFVGMRVNGKVSHWHRDPDGKVSARRGTSVPRELDGAIDALGSAFNVTVLDDPPWDE